MDFCLTITPSSLKKLSLIILILAAFTCNAQRFLNNSDTLNKARRNVIIGGTSALYAATTFGLQFAWYQQYQNRKFHFFNDWPGWQQMDKAGHAATAYQAGLGLYKINKWGGIDDKKALWWAVGTSYSFQLAVELMDGFSEGWGFSMYDLGFNTIGSGLLLSQELAWHEQRVQLKFSFTPVNYNQYNPQEQRRLRNLYGSTIFEQWLKDYNGQTYWLSANIWSLTGKSEKVPKWINVALGYSANNLLGAESNTWKDPDDETKLLSSNLIPERQFLLSLDIDLSKADLPNYLNWTKSIFGIVKFPFPALEWNTQRGLRGHILYF